MMHELSGQLLLDPDVVADPYPFYHQLHVQAPVWRVPDTDVFVVSSYDMVDEATRRVEDFSSNMTCLLYRDERGLPARMMFGSSGIPTLATADPPLHTVHKRTVFPEFVGKRMALLEPELTELVSARVEHALVLGRLDFMPAIGTFIPISMVSRLIGFRDSDLDSLLQSALDSTDLLGSMLSMEQLQLVMARSLEIQAWIAGQLASAADETSDDILSSIAVGVKAGALSEYEGVIIMQTLLSAGGESTASLLGNAVRILAEDQALQQRLRDAPELVPSFVEEALRLESPFRYLMRSAPRNTKLGGVDIPEGSTLLVFWGAANRDGAQFERPDELVLERPRRHVAFGRGVHQCVGAPLARLEGKTVLNDLLQRTRRIELDPDDPPVWIENLLVRRHARLPVHLTPR